MTSEQIEDIRADIAAFADDEAGVVLERGKVLFERDRVTYECQLSQTSGGQVEIEYGGRKMGYLSFLAEELGRLPILAHAVRQKRSDVVPYVDTKGTLYDALGTTISGRQSALASLRGRCSYQVPGETRLVLLTADAGEGKTALLRRLTQACAADYLSKKSSWFLLHIDTQGRSFVRLEEAVAGELGQLRVSGLFYSGIVRLIRHGLLAIAIDGFDELLAEIGSAEAYSGLGAFLRQLGGAGVVVAAARSAYFEAENYAAQSKLLSSLPDVQVAVEHMRLERWGKEETLSFFSSYEGPGGARILDPGGLYDEMEGMLGPGHVVLQRPFLVQQLAKILVAAPSSTREIVEDIGPDVQKVVPNVIRSFLKREVDEKWRDPNGLPYLTLDQHVRLLAAVAEEMWIQSSNSLPVEMVQLVAETVLDEFGVPTPGRIQVLERVKAHALLPAGAARQPSHRAFDHEEFLNYFLAACIAGLLGSEDWGGLRRFLERHPLPRITAKWAAVIEPWAPARVRKVISGLGEICSSELRSGHIKQNAGLLAAALARLAPRDLRFDSMYFESDVFAGSEMAGATFRRCVFNDVVLVGAKWSGCHFQDCQILGLALAEARLDDCVFDPGCEVVGVIQGDGSSAGFRTYVPETCEAILRQCGARFERSATGPARGRVGPVPREIRAALEGFLRIFQRNTGAVDTVIQLKLGQKLSTFDRSVLPVLLDSGVVRRTQYHGRGVQNRYELCYPVEAILRAEDPDSGAPAELILFWDSLRKEGGPA